MNRRTRIIPWALGFAALAGSVFYVSAILPMQLARKAERVTAKPRKKNEKAKDKRPAQSVIARTGLPNLRAKLAAHAPVTVAFLGGSITKNASEGGFVSEVAAWIAAQAVGVQVETVNAGISKCVPT